MFRLLLSKLTGFILRIFKKGGNLPGIILYKKDKRVLKRFKVCDQIILITGTNGKTSLTNQVAQVFSKSGKKVVTNSEGNNLYTGIVALLARKSTLNYRVKCDVLILEVDEMSLASVMADLKPMLVVVNNLFRDQLDRVGEMENLIMRIQNAVSDYKGALLLNGDDPNVARLGINHPYATYFGVNESIYSQKESNDAREGRICPVCENFIEYSYYNYSHLGGFTCSNCSFGRHNKDFYVRTINDEKNTITINDVDLVLNDISLYLVYNAANLFAIATLFEIDAQIVQSVLSDYNVSKGRNESFIINGRPAFLALVKNPVGFNETMKFCLSRLKSDKVTFVIAVNDNEPDGIDVSWLYDTEFELLLDSRVQRIICTGTRAYDLAIRLKVMGFTTENIIVDPLSEQAIKTSLTFNDELIVLSCYTQLQTIRKQLSKLK